MHKPANLLLVLALIAATCGSGIAAEPIAGPASGDVSLSADVAALLRAEMRELAGGTQAIALALPAGDWKAIADAAGKLRSGYIMDKSLTAAQRDELERALPERFKTMDAEFHQRAEKLVAAANQHDAETAAFQYWRLLETCTVCHSAFAKARFPGLAPARAPAAEHRH